jgi:excisionase family DNA binding protein
VSTLYHLKKEREMNMKDHDIKEIKREVNVVQPSGLESDTFLTVSEVAEKLKVSRPTVLSWIHGKKTPLPYYSIGNRSIRIKHEDLKGWLLNRRKNSVDRVKKLVS